MPELFPDQIPTHTLEELLTNDNIVIGGNGVTFGSGNSILKFDDKKVGIEGSITTVDDTIVTIPIISVPYGKCLIIDSTVLAVQDDNTDHASFIRNASFINSAGTVSLRDQVQDLFSKSTKADWNTDFANSGDTVQIRVQGESGTNILWHYKINYLISD